MKCANLVKSRKAGREEAAGMFKQLSRVWLKLLPDAQTQACANVLWACGTLGVTDAAVWDSTWEAYLDLQKRQTVNTGAARAKTSHQISNALLACVKLSKQPPADDLQLLLQTFLQPAVLSAAAPQAIANTTWALSQLHQLKSWQGGVSQQGVIRLLGQDQLQLLLAKGNTVDTSNVVFALARISTGPAPFVSLSFAQAATRQLLAAAARRQFSCKAGHLKRSQTACGHVQPWGCLLSSLCQWQQQRRQGGCQTAKCLSWDRQLLLLGSCTCRTHHSCDRCCSVANSLRCWDQGARRA